jgi:hypothetical protein
VASERDPPTPGTRNIVHIALLGSCALWWVNVFTTGRWTGVEGAITGARLPFFLFALGAATLALSIDLFRQRTEPPSEFSRRSAQLLAACGALLLGAAFLVWFPLQTWWRIPFLDDWPIRYQSALDMMRLLDRGAFTGWEWRFLGGYHSSSDATQGLGTLAYLPMKTFGPQLGFHLLHVALFALVPLLVRLDLSLAPDHDRRVTTLAAGFACLLAAGYAYVLIRSGDTNSLGGVVMALATLTGAHAARERRVWGNWLLVAGLSLTAYAHPGFFGYTCLYLALDAVVARDIRSFIRAVVAGAAGLVVSLPLSWEIWRYPSLFQFNNVVYRAPESIDWPALARAIYYNVELLFLPWRWFNDYTGVTYVLLPVTLVLAWRDRGRTRFYAIAAVCTVALMRLHNIHAGYVFLRPMHMLPALMAPVLAVALAVHLRSVAARWSVIAALAVYVHIWWQPVPHVDSVRDFNAALVDRVASAPGALVLLENNPHRNMNAAPGGETERSRFGTHFEVLVAEQTGRRLYSGGHSDGWQWNPWKGQVVAGGTFMGRGLPSVPQDEFVAELRRWGVSDLLVWSPTSIGYLDADSRFERVWTDAPWTQFRLTDADVREVVMPSGTGHLEGLHPFGGDVVLEGVRAGDPVVVRTNFHPAWSAGSAGHPVLLHDSDGQLSFAAPCDGNCRVTLAYPVRRGLIPLALATLVCAVAALSVIDRRHSRPRR